MSENDTILTIVSDIQKQVGKLDGRVGKLEESQKFAVKTIEKQQQEFLTYVQEQHVYLKDKKVKEEADRKYKFAMLLAFATLAVNSFVPLGDLLKKFF